MNPLENCSQLDCILVGAIVVLLLCLLFRREKFDTSQATRSQVGDSINLDTMHGLSGSFDGDIYRCNKPILTVQPDAAFSWGDSKDFISDASLAHIHPDAVARTENAVSSRRQLDLEGMCMPCMSEQEGQVENLSGVESQYEPFDPTRTYYVGNSTRELRQPVDNFDPTRTVREGLMRDKRSETMVPRPTDARSYSESALSGIMVGGSVGGVAPPRALGNMEGLRFTRYEDGPM